MAKPKLVAEMDFIKSTKGAHRLEEKGFTDKTEDYIFGSLYIRKAKLPDEPKRIRVTVEVLE